jgi:hypothetical protein
MREFQQLLCNLWLNWSWLYCQCSVFLGEVFSRGILWRAPNSLDAIFQTDKFSLVSFMLMKWGLKLRVQWPCFVSAGAFNGICYVFALYCANITSCCLHVGFFLVDWVRIMGFGPASYKDFVFRCLLVNRVKSMLVSLTHLESFSLSDLSLFWLS